MYVQSYEVVCDITGAIIAVIQATCATIALFFTNISSIYNRGLYDPIVPLKTTAMKRQSHWPAAIRYRIKDVNIS